MSLSQKLLRCPVTKVRLGIIRSHVQYPGLSSISRSYAPKLKPVYMKSNTLSTIARPDLSQTLQKQAHSLEGAKITSQSCLPSVQCLVRARLPTPFGTDMYLHLYRNDQDNKEHLAMVFGNTIASQSLLAYRPDDTHSSRLLRGAGNQQSHFFGGTILLHDEGSTREKPVEENSQGPEDMMPLVRVHSECFTGETAWSNRCDCGDQLTAAARLICQSTTPHGVIVYLRQEGRGIGLENKLRAYNLQDQGADTVEANQRLGFGADDRTYGVATSILCDLGLGGETGIRLLTNNPDKVAGIRGPGDQVKVRQVLPMKPSACKSKSEGADSLVPVELLAYLQTKIQKFGHTIEL